MDLPGEDVFLATGGGVFLLAGTGDFSFGVEAANKDRSGVLLLSLRMGKVRSWPDPGDLLLSFENNEVVS